MFYLFIYFFLFSFDWLREKQKKQKQFLAKYVDLRNAEPQHLSHNTWEVKGKCNMCYLCTAPLDEEQPWYKETVRAANHAQNSALLQNR